MNRVSPAHLLRNVPVRELGRALLRDCFVQTRSRRAGGNFYKLPDGRRTEIHYNPGSDVLTRKTLGDVLTGTEWAEEDLRRPGLI